MITVAGAMFQVLRKFGMSSIFTHAGPESSTFVGDLPSDFSYITTLQADSALAIAIGYSIGRDAAALAIFRSKLCLEIALAAVLDAYHSKAPVIILVPDVTYEPSKSLVSCDELVRLGRCVKSVKGLNAISELPQVMSEAYSSAMQEPKGPVVVLTPPMNWNETLFADMGSSTNTKTSSEVEPMVLGPAWYERVRSLPEKEFDKPESLSVVDGALKILKCVFPENSIWVEEFAGSEANSDRIVRFGTSDAEDRVGIPGFAIPLSIGLQLANSERQVICCLDELSLHRSIQDLRCAVRYGTAVIFLVLSNAGYSAPERGTDLT